MQLHSSLREWGGFGYRSQGRSKPGNCLPEMAHIPHRLLVAIDLAFIHSHAQVPVEGTGDDHRGYEEHVVYDVEHMGRTTAPNCHDYYADLAAEHSAIGQHNKAD